MHRLVVIFDRVLHTLQLSVLSIELLHAYFSLYFPHCHFVVIQFFLLQYSSHNSIFGRNLLIEKSVIDFLFSDLSLRILYELEEVYLQRTIWPFECTEANRDVEHLSNFTSFSHLVQTIELSLSFALVYGQCQCSFFFFLLLFCQFQVELCLVLDLSLS